MSYYNLINPNIKGISTIVKDVDDISGAKNIWKKVTKFIEKDAVILNTIHYAVKVTEAKEGVIIDIFHRHGDLIDTHTYWNDDVIEPDNYIFNQTHTTKESKEARQAVKDSND